MSRQGHLRFDIIEHLGDLAEKLSHVRLDDGRARIEHRPILVIDNLDAQAIGGHIHLDLILHIAKPGIALKRLLDPLLYQFGLFVGNLLHVGGHGLDGIGLPRRVIAAAFDLTDGAGEILTAATQHT